MMQRKGGKMPSTKPNLHFFFSKNIEKTYFKGPISFCDGPIKKEGMFL
jgi:hypothetical protein